MPHSAETKTYHLFSSGFSFLILAAVRLHRQQLHCCSCIFPCCIRSFIILHFSFFCKKSMYDFIRADELLYETPVCTKKEHLKNFCFSSVLKFCQIILYFANAGLVLCNRIQLKFIGKMFLLNQLVNFFISAGLIADKGIQLLIRKSKTVFIRLSA